jgi:hypothetical protein
MSEAIRFPISPCPACGAAMYDDDEGLWFRQGKFFCSEACARKGSAK